MEVCRATYVASRSLSLFPEEICWLRESKPAGSSQTCPLHSHGPLRVPHGDSGRRPHLRRSWPPCPRAAPEASGLLPTVREVLGVVALDSLGRTMSGQPTCWPPVFISSARR